MAEQVLADAWLDVLADCFAYLLRDELDKDAAGSEHLGEETDPAADDQSLAELSRE